MRPKKLSLDLHLPEQETRPDSRALMNNSSPMHSSAIMSTEKHRVGRRHSHRRSDNSQGNVQDVGLLDRSYNFQAPGSQNVLEGLVYSTMDTESNIREIRQQGSLGVINTNG
ncbi:uncharacterized protein LOC143785427 [Ranitomeya variabilis]|uniref:uncharacterized protein LOC143785427 n=1 Tax=Ranitomeya variabilis TaxID=490064 RepID=UPI0040577AE4